MSVDSIVDRIPRTTTRTAFCHDCKWSSDEGQHIGGARKAAYLHTYQSGHRTECTAVKTFRYEEDCQYG